MSKSINFTKIKETKVMNTEIFLVRHGETEWNATGKFQGCTDINLSDTGIIQAKYAKSRLKNKFDVIYASPLKRAMQTAQIISEDSGIKPVISKDLREINFGKWEGLTVDEIKVDYNSEFNSWQNDDENAYLVGGDMSLKNASIRGKNAILAIAEKCKGKRIVIAAHGGIIKAALVGIFGWKMTMYHHIALNNASISNISFYSSTYPLLTTLNDTSHLPEKYKRNPCIYRKAD